MGEVICLVSPSREAVETEEKPDLKNPILAGVLAAFEFHSLLWTNPSALLSVKK